MNNVKENNKYISYVTVVNYNGAKLSFCKHKKKIAYVELELLD